jgi:hypothetical protein
MLFQFPDMVDEDDWKKNVGNKNKNLKNKILINVERTIYNPCSDKNTF